MEKIKVKKDFFLKLNNEEKALICKYIALGVLELV